MEGVLIENKRKVKFLNNRKVHAHVSLRWWLWSEDGEKEVREDEDGEVEFSA